MWSLFQCHRISWTTPPVRIWWCERVATWRYGARRQEHRSRRSRGVARRVARSACQTGTKVRIFALVLLLLLRRTLTGYVILSPVCYLRLKGFLSFDLYILFQPYFVVISSLSRTLNVTRSQNNICTTRLFLTRAKTEHLSRHSLLIERDVYCWFDRIIEWVLMDGAMGIDTSTFFIEFTVDWTRLSHWCG